MVALIVPKKKMGPKDPTTMAVILSQNLWKLWVIIGFGVEVDSFIVVDGDQTYSDVTMVNLNMIPFYTQVSSTNGKVRDREGLFYLT